MPDSLTGSLIDGRYRVLSRLGAGGMADVFLAEDEQLGRKVAVKLLHRRFAEDPGFVERFRREAQSAAALQHPNVVNVYDRGSYDGTYYIAMEYLPGRSLKQLIRQEAPIEPLRAIEITIQILKAARFAHRRGVIHRDLKPHNVIVDDADQAKVTDFGIARAGASDMTETGSIMGTAQYLSPEQAQGHAVSAGSDLYSVGVVLYELLTGRVPFDAESAVTIALKHVSEPPPPPRALHPDIPSELEQVVMWSLNKNPAERPTDADQFIRALEQVREHILAAARGERTASMLGLAGIVSVDEAYAGDGAATWTPDGVDDEWPPEGPGRNWWPWALAGLIVLLLAGGGVAAYLLTRPVKKAVPNVVNRQVGAATTILENDGFSPTVNNVTDTHRSGTVIRQSPDPGTKAKQGSIVTLTVSSGPASVSIPPVDNASEARAGRVLRAAGLKVTVQRTPSSSVTAGVAIRTDPAAGTTVNVGFRVVLFISTGPPQGTVPDVTTLSQSAAEAALRSAGFTNISTSPTTTSSAPDGTVISQSPSGNATEPFGTTINLVVAKAPNTVAVPRVKGQPAAAAMSAITAAGFRVSPQTETVKKQKNDGIVLSQSPRAGSKQPKGSTVTIIVGQYTAPPPTTTPTSTTTTTTPSSTTTTPSLPPTTSTTG